MSTLTGPGDPAVVAQFVDLIYQDPDLLAAEFDAIIAAQWPAPPLDPPGPETTGRHPTDRAGTPAAADRHRRLRRWRRPTQTDRRGRQRSPPPNHSAGLGMEM